MKLEEKKLLADIVDAISSIDYHLDNERVFEDYLQNKTKRRAVERELEIIGEAVSKLLKINPDIQISYAGLCLKIRNKVIHAYESVDDVLIWKVIMIDIPVLHAEAEKLLNDED